MNKKKLCEGPMPEYCGHDDDEDERYKFCMFQCLKEANPKIEI